MRDDEERAAITDEQRIAGLNLRLLRAERVVDAARLARAWMANEGHSFPVEKADVLQRLESALAAYLRCADERSVADAGRPGMNSHA